MIGIKNPIIRSTGIVVIAWWLILFFTWLTVQSIRWNDKRRLYAALNDVLPALTYVGIAILTPILILLAIHYYKSKNTEFLLRGKSSYGVNVSLGAMPDSLGIPPLIAGSKLSLCNDDLVTQWRSNVKKASPDHEAFFQTLIDLHAAFITVPATVVRSAHGDLSLADHSLNVMREIIALSVNYQYTGSKTARGYHQRDLTDPHYIFEPEDPLVPIIGFAHDVGKMECYVKNREGIFVEVKKNHDRVGSWLLSRLPAIHKLPAQDREDLLYVVSCYHHPSSMPLVASDRAWALMELLILADESASRKEGRLHSETKQMAVQIDESNTVSTSSIENDDSGKKEVQLNDYDQMLWTNFIDILLSPGRVNGNKAGLRVGYKVDQRLYLLEEPFRLALSEAMGDKTLAIAQPLGDGRVELTKKLLNLLDAKGILVKNIDGRTYSADRALFHVTFLRADKKPYPKQPPMFMIEPGDVIPGVQEIKNSRGTPGEIVPVWGVQSASNKSGKRINKDLAKVKTVETSVSQNDLSEINSFINQLSDAGNEIDQQEASQSPENSVISKNNPSQQWLKRVIRKLVKSHTDGIVTGKIKDNDYLSIALDDRARHALGNTIYERLIDCEGVESPNLTWLRGQINKDLIVIQVPLSTVNILDDKKAVVV